MQSSKDRELTAVEQKILLDDLANLNSYMTNGWIQTEGMLQKTFYLIVSLIISLVLTGHFLPTYFPLVIPGLVTGLTVSFIFFLKRVDALVWTDYWRDILARRLGAWEEPGLSWRSKVDNPPGKIRVMIARFYSWPFREWWLYANQMLSFTFLPIIIFGGIIFFLVSFLLSFGYNFSALSAVLLSSPLAVLWMIGVRSVTTFEIQFFGKDIKDLIRARFFESQEKHNLNN